jgi:restriction endonuclease S subunit
MKIALKLLTTIQFGNYYQPVTDGKVAYLQAKHFNEQGKFNGEVDSYIQPKQLNKSHLLKKGDILFAGKGFRNFAWCYHESDGPAIASSIFFIIRVTSPDILPEYISTIFNLPANQTHFQRLGAGSSIPSIRKNELAEFPVNLVSLTNQKKVISINDLYSMELELNQSIMQLKTELFQSVVTKLTNQ